MKTAKTTPKTAQRPPVHLEVRNLSVSFAQPGRSLLAVRDVSFTLARGTTLGLVGESGCGKSVTAYSIMRLVPPPGSITGGQISFSGRDLLSIGEEEMRSVRGREIAMIFQEPMTSLNPVFRIGYQIAESLRRQVRAGGKNVREQAVSLLSQVGIPNPTARYYSYPHELSGGMRQRVMIAMALAASPSMLIADEPTTALDVTIQSQILDLLLQLQQQRKMSMLLITHDLGIVANTADRVAIMYAGEIVETGSTRQIFASPLHPYTAGLFKAIPTIGSGNRRLVPIPGAVPSITGRPGECVFYPRCFLRADECRRDAVPLIQKGKGRQVRCIRV